MHAAVARWAVLVVGLIAIMVGIALLAQRTSSFGWFAYAPLPDTTFVSMSGPNIAGFVVLGIGLVLVSGWCGHRIALRRPKR